MDPQEIEQAQFKTTRLKEGYEADEVDAFLDRVAEELRQAQNAVKARDEEIVRLKRQHAEDQRMLEAYGDEAPTKVIPVVVDSPAPVTATLILEAAQHTADEVIAKAQQQAVEITKTADENARERSDEIVSGALKRRNEILGEVNTLEKTLAVHNDKTAQVRQMLSDMLARLENPQ